MGGGLLACGKVEANPIQELMIGSDGGSKGGNEILIFVLNGEDGANVGAQPMTGLARWFGLQFVGEMGIEGFDDLIDQADD